MSGGYGRDGYPGRAYGAPGEPDRQDGSVWHSDQHDQHDQDGYQDGYQDYDRPNDQQAGRGAAGYRGQDPGYDPQAYGDRGYNGQGYNGQGYNGQGYNGQGYNGQGYNDQAYGDPGYRNQAYGEQPREGQGYGGQGYEKQGYDEQADGDRGYDPRGYGQPGTAAPGYQGRGNGYARPDGGYPPEQGPGGWPGQARPGTGPRRAAADYGDWDQDQEQGDGSFLPGFGRRDDFDDSRTGRRGPARDDRYNGGYEDQAARPQRGGPASGGPGGPGGGGPGDWGGPGDDGSRDRDAWNDRTDRQPRRRRRATRWAPRILILVIFIALVAGGLVGALTIYHKYEARYHPADYAGQGTGDVTVPVMSGDTAFSLAPRLVQLGVVASERAFTNAVESATSTTGAQSTGLEVGYYVLHHHMQASIAYADLVNPKNRVQTTVTIPEGKRAVDVIAIVSEKTKIPLKNFQQVLAHPSQLGLPSYADGKVEGYLFPATYAIAPHETAQQILQAMVTRFNQEAQVINLATAAKSVGLTPTQLIIEASLAQAEGGSVSDYPKVAEVIRNRLAIGMHLQFDSTVLYGLGKYAVSATIKQTKTPGPYNTYLNAGLPAGPISNPGDAAIQGILNPVKGDWLFFLTVPGGKSQFSHTPLKGQ